MKILVTLIVFALEIFLIFAPWVPHFTLVSDNPSTREAFDASIAMMGVHASVLIAYVAALLAIDSFERRDEQKELREDHEKIIAGVERGEVRRLRDDEFYSDFLHYAKEAQSYVYISYFSPNSPDANQSAPTRQYYEDILKTIKKRPNVRFRRLVRDTPSNRAWLRNLITDLDGKPNADLGLLKDQSQNTMPLAMSVQVIDGKLSWLVATRSHDRLAEYRDVFVDDKVIAEEFRIYHDRLWDGCTKLVESGCVSVAGKAILQEGTDAADHRATN